jgi:AcrR family transcriptional regulator
MSTVRRRRYRQMRRAEQAERTRARILAAARKLFLAKGFHEVSIDAVAARARVARTTVFAHFASKRALLRATLLDISADAGVEALLDDLRSPDPEKALRAAVIAGSKVWASEAALFRKLEALAAFDSTLCDVLQEKEGLRQQQVALLIDRLPLKVARKEAIALFGALTSFAVFDALFQRTKSIDRSAAMLLRVVRTFIDL